MIADPQTRIREYIVTKLAPHLDLGQVGEETALLEAGVLESLHVLDLVLFLEGEFGVRIPTIDITPENFGTVRSIVNLVEECRR